MTIRSDKGYVIVLTEPSGGGATWIVKTYKTQLFWRRRISSDWFLDGEQARRFAQEIAGELDAGRGPLHLQQRSPGWRLHRSPH